MGGLGTSTGTSSTTSPWAGPLGQFGRMEMNISSPLLKTLGSEYLEALRTGGVNSFIPWITRAVDASRQAGSATMQDLRDNLAKSNLSGSSFGADISARTAGAVNQNTAMTPAELIMNFIQGAPNFATSVASSGAAAVGGAGALQNTTRTTSTPSFWDMFNQGLQSASGFFSGGGGGGSTSNFVFGGGSGGGSPTSGIPLETPVQ